MVVGMQKKVLTEQSLYYGEVSMPKYWEINQNELAHHILHSNLTNEEFSFSKTFDKLNTYIREHIRIKHNLIIENKDSWANAYVPNEKTQTLSHVNLMNLADSPDFVLLYGVNTLDCRIKINFDDNRRKGRSWDIELKNNMFIMFPSTNMYYITNTQKDSLNFVQTITYEFI